MNEPEDIQLLRAIRQGDEAAFQSLYRRHRSGLYSFALLHSGAPDVAADVVQDVFMGLLNDSYGFDPLKGMLANFLYGVARNLVLSHARQNSRWVQPAVDDDGDDCVVEIFDRRGFRQLVGVACFLEPNEAHGRRRFLQVCDTAHAGER